MHAFQDFWMCQEPGSSPVILELQQVICTLGPSQQLDKLSNQRLDVSCRIISDQNNKPLCSSANKPTLALNATKERGSNVLWFNGSSKRCTPFTTLLQFLSQM